MLAELSTEYGSASSALRVAIEKLHQETIEMASTTKNQSITIQNPHSGEALQQAHRTVHNVQNDGQVMTGTVIINGVQYPVRKSTNDPSNNWYG